MCRNAGLRVQGLRHIQPVTGKILQSGTICIIRRDPTARRGNRDAYAVVLTHKKQWQRHGLIAGPAGGVDRALRGRVVGGGITETAHNDGIIWQAGMLGARAACEAQ